MQRKHQSGNNIHWSFGQDICPGPCSQLELRVYSRMDSKLFESRVSSTHVRLQAPLLIGPGPEKRQRIVHGAVYSQRGW